MELTKNHRKSLIYELEKATQNAELQLTCMNKEKDADLQQWFEMSLFLALERIKLIKKSLTDNEIEF
jgi:hypothetical protein